MPETDESRSALVSNPRPAVDWLKLLTCALVALNLIRGPWLSSAAIPSFNELRRAVSSPAKAR